MASTDAKPVPRKNVAFRLGVDLWLTTGLINSGAAGLDSEVSKDNGTFADCTNEATEVATSSGSYYLDLTSTEMNADIVQVQVKSSTTNAITAKYTIYPAEATDIVVNVASINDVLATAVTTIKAVQGLATDGVVPTVTTVTNQLTGASIATAIWQDSTAGDFTTASSIGKALYVSNVAPGAAGGHFIAGTNAATTVTTSFTTTFTGNLTGSVASVTGNVGGNVTGTVGSVSGNVGGNVAGSVGSVTGNIGGSVANVLAISGSPTAADNFEIVFATDFATNYDSTLDRFIVDTKSMNGSSIETRSGRNFDFFFFNANTNTTQTLDAYSIVDVSGDVGGNVNGTILGDVSVGTIQPDVITGSALAASAVAEIQSGLALATSVTDARMNVVDSGTAQAATGTTLRLRSAAAFADDELIGARILITGGSTGVGQTREITDYVAATDTATVATWTTTPSGTITYVVFGAVSASAGSGLTAQQTRDAMQLAATGVTQSGSIDDKLDNLSASAGAGAFTISIGVEDSIGNALQNVRVRLTESTNSFTGVTNASGVAVFSLDAATYTVALTKPGYQFTNDQIIVTATDSFGFVMTEVAITPPSDPTLCRVGVYFLQSDAITPATGITFTAVLARNPTPTYTLGGAMLPQAARTSSASAANGLAYIDLPFSSDLFPSGTRWILTNSSYGLKNRVLPFGTTLNVGTYSQT